jgi:hypothetical protein
MAITINGSGTVTGISVGGLPDGIVDDGTLATDSVTAVKMVDNAVTLAKMAGGTDGEILTYDASGNPTSVSVGTDGQVLTSGGVGVAPAFEAVAAGGKVLQVISDTWNTSVSTTSTSWVDTGFDLVITPSATTSKIVVCWTMPFVCNNSNAATNQAQVSIFRDGTNLGNGTGGVYYTYSGGDQWKSHSGSFTGQDSPGTTSAVTYDVRIKSLNTSTNTIIGTVGRLTGFVMEIGA